MYSLFHCPTSGLLVFAPVFRQFNVGQEPGPSWTIQPTKHCGLFYSIPGLFDMFKAYITPG